MKIDNAAAAFRQAAENYEVVVDPGTDFYCVMEQSQDEGAPLKHGADLRYEDAVALMDQLAGRDGVTAVLREMISPIVITAALDKAGLRLEAVALTEYIKGRKWTLGLLLAIIDVLNGEAS